MSEQYVVDCLVVQDGTNPSFFSYMNHSEAQRIQECGLNNAEQVLLKETTDRVIPESLKQGVSEITDVLVRLELNTTLCLN